MELESLIGGISQRGRGGPSLSHTPPGPGLESKKRELTVGGWWWGREFTWYFPAVGECGDEGRNSNPGYPPSFKNYLNSLTSSCPENCLKRAPG